MKPDDYLNGGVVVTALWAAFLVVRGAVRTVRQMHADWREVKRANARTVALVDAEIVEANEATRLQLLELSKGDWRLLKACGFVEDWAGKSHLKS